MCIVAGLAGVLSLAGVAALSQPAVAGGLSPVSNGDKWAGVRSQPLGYTNKYEFRHVSTILTNPTGKKESRLDGA